MTEISITKRGRVYRLEARGHATTVADEDDGEGEKVCAAVSMLTSTLALSLVMIPGIDAESVCSETGEGYAKVSAYGYRPVKTLFRSAYCGAIALQITHPDRVKVRADKFFEKLSGSFDAIS